MSLIDVQFRWLKREKCKVTCNKSGAVIKTEEAVSRHGLQELCALCARLGYGVKV